MQYTLYASTYRKHPERSNHRQTVIRGYHGLGRGNEEGLLMGMAFFLRRWKCSATRQWLHNTANVLSAIELYTLYNGKK